MIDRKKGYFDEEQETLPPSKRKALQSRLLQETIRHAYENAPAARRKMEDAGVSPADIRVPADLMNIPLTRKADLKKLQMTEMPFGGLAAIPPPAMKRIYLSPGPTYDPEGREGSHWRWEKAYIAAGFRPGDIVQNTFSYHFSPGGMMFDDGLLRIGCTVIPAGVGNTEMQAQVMRDLGVTGYVGTPSFLMTILEKAREMEIVPGDGLKLQVGMVTAEMLPESLRGRFRDEFGIQVRQCYGTADVGSLGYECYEAKGMHIPDEIILELVDPATGKTVGPGEIGEVVVTLPNPAYPLIRFATGDLSVCSDEACPCGRTSARLLRIVGRVDQVTKVKGMFVHPEQVLAVEKKIPEAARILFLVTRTGHEDRLTVQVVLNEGIVRSDALTARIEEITREVTRLHGTVVFVGESGLADPEKRIVDNRTWD